jgi:hypothetical protein
MADEQAFCVPVDHSPRLGVLGVFTTPSHREYRDVIRASWFQDAAPQVILPKFVLRGSNLPPAVMNESRSLHDIVLVKGSSKMGRQGGPLISLLHWLECASLAWPNVQLIGKADDDIWLHLQGIAAYLNGALVQLDTPMLYFGLMESYSWDEQHRHATQFQFSFGHNEPCQSAAGLVGPFCFAKGAAFWLSTPLARQLAEHEGVRTDLLATAEAAELSEAEVVRGRHTTRSIPYEDVYLGLALARAARGASLTAVQLGKQAFSDLWGFFVAPSTLLWHQRFKDPSRIGLVHRWARRHHCALPPPTFECLGRGYIACSGAVWRRCSVRHNHSACSARRVDLKDYFHLRGPEARRRRRPQRGSRAECDALPAEDRRGCLSG